MLRPNLLSIYKSSAEDRLHKLINLSELTAVAYLEDPKGRRDHVFGLFTPSRDFHLQAMDEKDAREWVELIKRESRIDEEEQGFLLGSPIEAGASAPNNSRKEHHDLWDEDRPGSSSSEPQNLSSRPQKIAQGGVNRQDLRRPSTYEMEYSGDDVGLHSDLSDAVMPSSLSETLSRTARRRHEQSTLQTDPVLLSSDPAQPYRSSTEHKRSQMNIIQTDQDDARVIRQGYLLCLKSKGGVRQWKKHWAVLRNKNIAFYKSEDVSEFLLRCLRMETSMDLIRYVGVCCSFDHPAFRYHQRGRNRSDFQKQNSLHANHRCR